MAKSIRLDFSKVEERSGWNTRAIPEGIHKLKVESVQVTEAQDGTAMLVYALRPDSAKYKTRLFPFYCKLQQNQLWKLRDLFVAAGITVPKKATNINPEAPVGKFIAGEIEDESNAQYAGRSVVQGTYGLEILDDEDGTEPDDDDEEYEGDDEADDEEYEDAEEDEEDEEEDLTALTLVELRKRAKGLGLDTDGVKKADLIDLILEEESAEEGDDEDEDLDDDDDLDDEDLEDEDFDDEDEEEEEPAPAPKRRAAAKPAPKAAAPARRVVKRR